MVSYQCGQGHQTMQNETLRERCQNLSIDEKEIHSSPQG